MDVIGKVVFVSYAAPDGAAAIDLCRRLEERGIGCWIAPRDIAPGQDYGESIIRAIEASALTVLLHSSHADDSPHVRNEIERAVSKRKRIIPVRLENVPPRGSLELHLATAHWIEAWNLPPSEVVDKVIAVVEDVVSPGAAPHERPPAPDATHPAAERPSVTPRRTPLGRQRAALVATCVAVAVAAALGIFLLRESPLRVTAIDVRHFARVDGVDLSKGLIGRETFTPQAGDRVQVAVRLSKPAYAYLVAFRPDGKAELCFPAREDEPPPLTEMPRYPMEDDQTAYGLEEGTGLWAFAVVASTSRLPAWNVWIKEGPSNRQTWDPPLDVPGGTVWWSDGSGEVNRLVPPGTVFRGKGETLQGPESTLRQLTRNLRTGDDVQAAVIGFIVSPSD